MQEMTIEQALTLIAIFTPLNIFLWFRVGLGTYQLHNNPKKVSEGKHTTQHINDNYGAYIWLAGKKYN
ncbi:putative phage membrane protein [Streptococcus suis]|nr:hypothetical protein [Streptococcus suis]MBS8078427.1 hypothetical protein [Streptococcus suis]CYU90227.1 putative phage membrane protein [Streptococcus suis]CYV55567.1 putative phage membrane protein [Streptococcus suis]CYV74874.1 putative phage membrane protein [Streptococcus suis]